MSGSSRAVDPADMAVGGSIPSSFGVVAIGRNEGERLRRCLDSVRSRAAALVYVDSGSTDGSVELARSFGAAVIALDLSRPFTAARARNEGFRRLAEFTPPPELVQFVDGDCEVSDGWLETGSAFLDAHAEVAVVCGRNRERFPERSIYNRLADMEWDTPVGEARACGGNAMMRAAAFEQAGGFRDDLIAGEEPELCVRLRALGWHVWRLEAEMTLHDSAMTRFSQWWRRSMRAGYAFAEGAHLHGSSPDRHWVREARSARVWGGAVPMLIFAGVLAFGPAAAWALLVYPLQVLRLTLKGSGRYTLRALRALFLVLGKFPEALGQVKFLALQARGRRARLIEYK